MNDFVLALLGAGLGVALVIFGARFAPKNRVVGFVATAVGMFCVTFAIMVLFAVGAPVLDELLANTR